MPAHGRPFEPVGPDGRDQTDEIERTDSDRTRISRAASSPFQSCRCLIARLNRPCALQWRVIGLLARAGRRLSS